MKFLSLLILFFWVKVDSLWANSFDLRVVTELSPPYQIMQDGKVAGLATDKVRNLLKEASLSAEFMMYPWARAYQSALNIPNTLIYSIAKTPERELLFHFLYPVTEYQFGAVGLKENAALTQARLSTLKQYVVAVQRNDISHQWLIEKNFQEGTHYIVCPDIESSWKLLLNKKVDFIIESPDLMTDMLTHFNLPESTTHYYFAIPELATTGYLAANKKIHPTLLLKLQKALKRHN